MTQRLQTMNGDTVLEITDIAPTKSRLSEKTLVRRKEQLETSIARFTAALARVDAELALIATAKHEESTRR